MHREHAAPAISKPKGQHGGARPGSGCPKGSQTVDPEYRRIQIGIRLPKHLVDWMHTLDPSLTKTIEYAVNQLKERSI